MKLIQEYLVKIVLLIISSVIFIELFITYLLVTRAKLIYNTVYEETMKKTEEKSIEITSKIEEFATNLVTRYMTDLKLICKHAQLLNGNINSINNDELINKDSDILNNKNKTIYIGTIEQLKNKEELKNISSDNNFFDYINYYENEFENITSKNILLNSFFENKHKELNAISEDKEKSIKYIMSILKSIYIRRYIIKRKNMDYIRFFILNKNEIYIYPPEAYNNTNIFFF